MEKWITILIIVCICVIGIIKIILEHRRLSSKRDFSIEFTNKYREFCDELFEKNIDGELYQWLRMKSAKMQNMMGRYGVTSMFQPPFSTIMYQNYPIIYNGLSEIMKEYSLSRNLFSRSFSFDDNLGQLIRMIDDSLVTYIGVLENSEENMNSKIKNPIVWLREGIRFLVVLPISFVYWSGLIKYHTYNRLSDNFFVKIIAMFITLIGLISSVITIILGYEPLIDIYIKIKDIF
ncbi:MAG: hypothetical protein N4A57_08060 [Anaeromicrobium sp.]|jgi:hypothetical protein|uniref:hypothetical protein n=1 Tax=Anaeromicrobium sp. TaxID=1929132 RepID=UPI0025D6C160|nr:hypothetical protein [Anaeromicrobium sp.]MCT4594205.1 hypothetical protein [Anaeromicrobium sp.]